MKVEVDGVIGGDGLGDAVGGLFFFFLEGTKHPVPNDKGGSIVFVQVVFITGMVYPVVGGGDKNVFYGRRQFFDVLCMDPELIQYAGLMTNKEHERIKTHKDGRDEKDELDMLCPAQAEGDREIVFLGVVMGDMGGPPKSLFMGYPVRPVVAKVDGDKAKHKGPPGDGNFEWGNVPEK